MTPQPPHDPSRPPHDPYQPYPDHQPNPSYSQPYQHEQPYPYEQPYPSFRPSQAPISGPPVPSAPPVAHGPVSGVPSGSAVARPGRRRRLGPGQKAALYVGSGTLAVLLLCGLGATAIGALVSSGEQQPVAAGDEGLAATPAVATAPNQGAGTPTPGAPTPAATSAPAVTPTAAQGPVVERKTITETRSIAFGKRTVRDSSLAKGKTKVRTRGVAGVKTLTYEVTVTDGVETARKLVRQQVTRQPVTEVVAVGTKETSRCDPNYSGCVPIASDVDCAGGSGDGPAYVRGPVRVIGEDKYGLDHDDDGYGCE